MSDTDTREDKTEQLDDLIINGQPARLIRRQTIEELQAESEDNPRTHRMWLRWQRRGLVARVEVATGSEGEGDASEWVFYEFDPAVRWESGRYGRYELIKVL